MSRLPAAPSAVLAALALAATFAAPSMAMEPQGTTAAPARAVLICASDSATRRSFEREHGAAPIFVSAREALAAASAGETWSTPRCMTEREHARLVQITSERAAAR